MKDVLVQFKSHFTLVYVCMWGTVCRHIEPAPPYSNATTVWRTVVNGHAVKNFAGNKKIYFENFGWMFFLSHVFIFIPRHMGLHDFSDSLFLSLFLSISLYIYICVCVMPQRPYSGENAWLGVQMHTSRFTYILRCICTITYITFNTP